MRRDSYRELPVPGPLNLVLLPGEATGDQLLTMMGPGLYVTGLTPWSTRESDHLMVRISGYWMEPGQDPRPIRPAFARLPGWEEIGRLQDRGADIELDHHGTPVCSPSLLLERLDLIPA